MSIFSDIISKRQITTINKDDLKGCEKITNHTFYHMNIEYLYLADSIKEIEGYAFYGMPNASGGKGLKALQLPAKLKTLGNNAFNSMFIEEYTMDPLIIPDSVETIGNSVFVNFTTRVTSITVGASVKTIGNSAFKRSTGTVILTEVIFKQPATMTDITLPVAGSDTGMFYTKSATPLNIYTDNEIIKNYAWARDNITPTFYHLDGTAWS